MGNLLRFQLLPGSRYDTIGVAPLNEGSEFAALLGHKAFDANWIVQGLDQRGAKSVISQHPRRSQELKIDAEMYKWRHLIESFLCKLKELSPGHDSQARRGINVLTIYLGGSVVGPVTCSGGLGRRH